MKEFRIILMVASVLLAAASAPAEWVEFAEGGSAQVDFERRGDSITILAPGGPYHFLASDFRHIEPIPWPERAWPQRKQQALSQGAEPRTEAAFWALERGLASESAAMLRAALQADPNAQPARRCVRTLDRLQAPCPPLDLEPIRRALGGSFQALEGPHVVLLHQTDPQEAADRLAFLETIVSAYYLEWARLGFALPAPQSKRPVAWFASRDDYRAFLKREGAEAFLSTRGYHHPARRLVAFYDARSDPDQQKQQKNLETRLAELKTLETGVKRMTARDRVRLSVGDEPPRTLDRTAAEQAIQTLRRRLDRQKLLTELSRLRLDLGTSAHEMIHSLVASSRLAPGPTAFPDWLHEALAMQFEAVRGDRWAGLAAPSSLRLDDYRLLRPAPPLEPLLLDLGFGHGYRQAPYASAWALLYDLRARQPEALVALIDRLRLPGGNAEQPNQVADAFSAAVGTDLPAYQRGWHQRMSRLPDWGYLSEPPPPARSAPRPSTAPLADEGR